MGETTAIAWTDHTFSPWWGCTRVSEGCQHCYAETFAKRLGNDIWGKTSERRFFGDKHWNNPVRWNKKAAAEGIRRRVFCASMADVFESREDLVEPRDRLFDLIRATPWLDWQLLTKRPEKVLGMVPTRWFPGGDWPSNCWIGTTVENQDAADERIPILAMIPSPIRFLSVEPMIGDVDLSLGYPFTKIGIGDVSEAIDWVICGGESGANHRPLDLDAARQLRDQCRAFEIPFFFKQVGGRTPTAGGDMLDGVVQKEFPVSKSGLGF